MILEPDRKKRAPRSPDAEKGFGAGWPPGARMAAAAVFLLLSLGTSPALADPCPVTDPACLTEAADDPAGQLEETVEDASRTVQETVETVQGTADQVVTQAGDAVDDLLRGGDEPGGGDDGRGDRGRHSGRTRLAGDEDLDRTTQREPPLLRSSFEQDTVPGRVPVPADEERQDGSRRRLTEVATHLAFPAVLALLLAWFLVVQSRMDRKDPRLSLAPLAPDFVTFE